MRLHRNRSNLFIFFQAKTEFFSIGQKKLYWETMSRADHFSFLVGLNSDLYRLCGSLHSLNTF